jgi:hypothetical protein
MNRKDVKERLSDSKLVFQVQFPSQVTYKMFGLLLEQQRRIQRDIMRRLEAPSSSDTG